MQYLKIFKAPIKYGSRAYRKSLAYDELKTEINKFLHENSSSQIVSQMFDSTKKEVIALITFSIVDEEIKNLWSNAATLMKAYSQALEKANKKETTGDTEKS